MAARVLAQYEPVGWNSYRLRSHDLVAERIVNNAVLVYARLMCEGITSDDRFVRLHLTTNYG